MCVCVRECVYAGTHSLICSYRLSVQFFLNEFTSLVRNLRDPAPEK